MPSASFTIRKTELNEEKLEAVNKLSGEVPVKKEREKIKAFISWCESNNLNHSLVKDLLDPFLTELGFVTCYYNKNIKFGKPTEQIYSLMDECEIIIGLYTKDEGNEETGYASAGNVVYEMGRARSEDKVILCEEGVKISSMPYSQFPSILFTRNNYGKLLLDLLKFLNNNELLRVGTFADSLK